MKAIAFAMACLFLTLWNGTAFAQNTHGTIKGRVTAEDGILVPGVGIRIKDSRKQTVTNDEGTFTLRNIAPGNYIVESFVAGHDIVSKNVTVTAGETVEVDFALSASQQTLQEVIIAGGRNKFAKKESGFVAKMPLKNLENPQVYNIVSSEIIQEQGIIDYREAIKNVAGVNSTEMVGNGRTSTIIRGFRTANYVRNGLVANQLVTVDIANLESIEVIKGPSGTLFGSGAVSYGGLVNRVTKKPFETSRTDISLTGGSYNLNRLTIDMNTPLNEDKSALLRVNVGRFASESFQEAGFRRNYFLAAAFSYKASERLTFLVDVEMFRNYGTPSVAYIAAPPANTTNYADAMSKYYYRTYYSNDVTATFPGYNVFAQMNYQINSKWNTTTVFSTGGVNAREQLQFSGTLVAGEDSISRIIQKYSHNYNSINIQQNLNGEFNTGAIRHRVLVGADYLADITQPTFTIRTGLSKISLTAPTPLLMREEIDRRLSTATPATYFKSHIDRYGIYAADVINLTERLIVMASVRWDKGDNRGSYSFITNKTTGAYNKSSFSPKFGAVYQIIPEQLSVFANYMNGFQYLSQTDRNGNVFNPEQANQWEGGVKADLFSSKLNITLSAYDIQVKDKVRADPADMNFSIQDASQRSKGFELEVISNPLPGLNIMAGYGFNESEFTVAPKEIIGKRPARSAGKHIANSWISYRLMNGKVKGLGIGGGVFYNSETPFDDANTLFFPAYATANGTVFYDKPGYRIGVRVDNLSNVKYWGPWGEPQMPRNYAVNLTIKL